MMKHLLIAVSLLLSLSDQAFAQKATGTAEERAARRACWISIRIDFNKSPEGPKQVAELKACVMQKLGRPDPFMDRFKE